MEETHTTTDIILIIEDDDFLRSLTVTKLEKEGFSVEIAEDGEEGLEKIKTLQPKLILLDLMLPKIDGFGIMQQLKDENMLDGGKIIIFSNLGSEEDIRRGKEFGVEDYLVKSAFTLDELVEKIKTSLSPTSAAA